MQFLSDNRKRTLKNLNLVVDIMTDTLKKDRNCFLFSIRQLRKMHPETFTAGKKGKPGAWDDSRNPHSKTIELLKSRSSFLSMDIFTIEFERHQKIQMGDYISEETPAI